MSLSDTLTQLSGELLITFFIVFIGWMRLTSTTQEAAFEHEQRLRNSFGVSAGEAKTFSNIKDSEYGVTVENVVFRERDTFWYMLKWTLWPWQDIEGETQFGVWTKGMIIEDMDAFEEGMPDWGRIVECTSEHHDNHYTVTLDTEQENIPWDAKHGYDTFFHYFANNSHMMDADTT